MTDALASPTPTQMVPGEFAEKAMASLMSMHTELMDEKERRVELYRKLMEREQTVAELRMYIRLLEEKLEPKPEPVAPVRSIPVDRPQPVAAPVRQVHVSATPVEPQPQVYPQPYPQQSPMPQPVSVSAYTREPNVAPPLPPRVARPKVDGWKTW
jgi:hypothetical protein